MSTATIPARYDGETMAEWAERVKGSADHWRLCLRPTAKGGLCRNAQSCNVAHPQVSA